MSLTHAVAITRMPPSASGAAQLKATDFELQLLARLLGVLPFDLRPRLAGVSPWILARTANSFECDRLVMQFRELGFGAVSVALDALDILTPRLKSTVTFEDETLVIQPDNIRVNLAHIATILVANHSSEHSSETITEEVVGHTARGQQVKQKRSHYQYDRKVGKALYLATEFNRELLCISQEEIRLPWVEAITARERMDKFVDALIDRCPFARIDRSMVDHPRVRREDSDAPKKMHVRDSMASNRFECDLAARAIITAIQQGQ